ncbi:hypothetical protein [Thermomonospora cellulosilytica]|uniref:Uncharacterized protein n=1 Tax=Thermomonospora cellulosilytica TaxID=1411118 RepID=A0A7W3MXL1_9ACTN|nr:hypothetical protein [Thermomonospora cellulosilytica]MBA9003682.1 hypothetical protein [Thermomonospora cellulosilytica]
MTDRDPDLAAALDDATRELERRFAAGAVADPRAQAEAFMTWLTGRGLHLIPRPDLPGRRPGSGAPPTPEWRQAKAALTRRTRPEEDR